MNEHTGGQSVDTIDIGAMIDRARRAQRRWAGQSIDARVQVLSRFRAALFARRSSMAELIAVETGKPVPEALIAEVGTVLEGARFLERVAANALAPQRIRSATPALWRKRITTHCIPHGVVAVVSPWNYPLLLTAMHVLPALVAGNAVILKPSELTPRTADLLMELLAESGLPDGIMQLLHGDGRAGATLVNADIDKVFFTGSEQAGRSIAAACAPRFIPASLELGGSDAAIVLEDADLDIAASGIVWGRFVNAGQTCVAVKRVIAVDSVYEPLLERIIRATNALRIGEATIPGTDVGPLVSNAQKALIDEQLDDALAKGATLVARVEAASVAQEIGATRSDWRPERGHVFAPLVVLTNVTPDMRVWREETFGPVLTVMRASDAEDAIAKANATTFGLSGSVWTRNVARGRDVARRMEAGSIAVNDSVLTAGVPDMSHGGFKSSGVGRVHGIEGLMECVRTRTVIDDFLPRVRQPWWFGYGSRLGTDVDGYLRFTHAPTLLQRLSGISGTVRLLFSRERPV